MRSLSTPFIIIWTAIVINNAYGISPSTSNSNMNIVSSPLPSSINGSFDVNQSFTNKPMTMNMVMERGDIAMGFDQNKIVHKFVVTSFGGSIIITALNSSDKQTINQIKNHILDIQKEFSQGNFTKPFFIHAQEVPGTEVMSEKKDLIKYSMSEIKNGSSLNLSTNDKGLIDAIGQFMEFQALGHHGH